VAPTTDTATSGDVAPEPVAEPAPEIEPRVALGVFQPEVPGADALDQLASQLGREPAIVMWYQAWGDPNNRDLSLNGLERVKARGAVPMITWEPWVPGEGISQSQYQLTNLCTRPGESATELQQGHNAYIDSWAGQLAAYGGTVLLRFAHEMNGHWYPWATGYNDNEPIDYIAAWKCLRERFAAAGADNVLWVWSPNIVYGDRATDLATLYPGDAEVDWLALDGYNWGAARPSDWQSFADVFDVSLRELEGLSTRPVMIAETASAETGGDKAAWIREAMLETIRRSYPQIRAFVWFNEEKETDWRFTSSAAAHDAFREAAAHPYYQDAL